MQTILGANGQIADVLAHELHEKYTADLRLVSRNPRRIHDTDQLFPANLLSAHETDQAVQGSDIAYLTVGLPMDGRLWAEQFPVIMRNVINACRKHDCKLAFFDNTYMYPKTSDPQTEETPFHPVGVKSVVRAEIATMLLGEINAGAIEAVICRAPEFYGPDKTQGITNSFIFENIRHGKELKVPLRDDTLRTLIWTPDASRALALIANTPEAYNQTWHLPCDDDRLTYKMLIELAAAICHQKLRYSILDESSFHDNTKFSELEELLPRYMEDNIFVSDKFKAKFPDFRITTYKEGVAKILRGS